VFIISSHYLRKKFNLPDQFEKKMSYNLYRRSPLEVRLELCGFLSLAEWTQLAEHNRKTRRMLMDNQRYLAPIPRLHSVSFVCATLQILFITRFIST
jgi:hypothetical protein